MSTWSSEDLGSTWGFDLRQHISTCELRQKYLPWSVQFPVLPNQTANTAVTPCLGKLDLQDTSLPSLGREVSCLICSHAHFLSALDCFLS